MKQEELNSLLKERIVFISEYNIAKEKGKILKHRSIFDEERKMSIKLQYEALLNKTKIENKIIKEYDLSRNRKTKLKVNIHHRRIAEMRGVARFEKKNLDVIEVSLKEIVNSDEYPTINDVHRISGILFIKPKLEIIVSEFNLNSDNKLNFSKLQRLVMKNAGNASFYLEKIILKMKKDHNLFLNKDLGSMLALWKRKLDEIDKIYPLTREMNEKEKWFKQSSRVEGEYIVIKEN